MLQAIVDTHAFIWYLFDDARLSSKARNFLQKTFQMGNQVGISAITLIEIIYLVEKNRVHSEILPRIQALLVESDSAIICLPVDQMTSEAVSRVPREQIPEIADRIIAATGVQYQVPIVSRDAKIQASNLETIW